MNLINPVIVPVINETLKAHFGPYEVEDTKTEE